MKDIIEALDGNDLNVMDQIAAKAGNVLSIQQGALEYAPDFGIDMKFFLDTDLQFQNESFKAYLVQRLTESLVNVAEVMDTVDALSRKYTHFVGDVKDTSGGLIL
jgi:hypothetical protein